MSTTTTVRLSEEEREMLAVLADHYGGQSQAIRQAIHVLAQKNQRQLALREFLDDWAEEEGPLEPEEVEAMRRRYFD